MASIVKEPNGRKRIEYVDVDGKRPKVRLGKVSLSTARSWQTKIEKLLEAKIAQTALDMETAKWVSQLDEKMAKRLAVLGLIRPRESAREIRLGDFLDGYFEKRTDVKQSTHIVWSHAKRNLIEYFGADRRLDSITSGDAKDFERWLSSGEARENSYGDVDNAQGLAVNTVRKRIRNAKQFFADAVERELIPRNPFAALKSTVGGNRKRDYFVSREDSLKVLDSCPDAEWRLIFALARFGGLRCPTEILALRWEDIDWAGERFVVHSAKTEHYEGKDCRVVPLFPEIRQYLEEVLETKGKQSEYVITRYRSTNANLRSQLERIVKRAGLAPWPKLFQNLRATRATELAADHPSHVAAAWIGHSTAIATKHYWQVTEDDFAVALKTAQNAAQSSHEMRRTAPQALESQMAESRETQGNTVFSRVSEENEVGATGLEPVTSAMSTRRSSQLS